MAGRPGLELPGAPLSEEGFAAASAYAQWHLGDSGWAALILAAYLHPKLTLEELALEKVGSPPDDPAEGDVRARSG